MTAKQAEKIISKEAEKAQCAFLSKFPLSDWNAKSKDFIANYQGPRSAWPNTTGYGS
jgi:hypothetical protein